MELETLVKLLVLRTMVAYHEYPSLGKVINGTEIMTDKKKVYIIKTNRYVLHGILPKIMKLLIIY